MDNPLTDLVEAERALFSGDLASSSVLWGWTAAVGLAAIGLAVGIRPMAHSGE
jgi:ABC-2 type transport system permease protein